MIIKDGGLKIQRVCEKNVCDLHVDHYT